MKAAKTVVSGDYDQDGDPDVFVGGRLVPGRYPSPANSYILKNENGRFKNVTEKVAPFPPPLWPDYRCRFFRL